MYSRPYSLDGAWHIYNSRNLICTLDFFIKALSTESTTVEI